MGRGWGERPEPVTFGTARPQSRSRGSFSVVSFSSNLGRLAFATAYVVFDQSSVRNESWGKEMTTLANMDETHDTQARWGRVMGLGPLQSCEQGHSGLPAPFCGLSSRSVSVLVL